MRMTNVSRLTNDWRVATRDGRVDPPEPPKPEPPPPPDPPNDALARAQYEAESARAEAAKIKKQLDDIQRQLPSDEQRARWASLETQHQEAEELRRRKEGEFDLWRQQISERHQQEIDVVRQEAANNAAQAAAREKELNDTLIGLAFSSANEWFGPTAKSVLMPAVAQSYFSPHVSVETVPSTNGGNPLRRVIVKDQNGATIVDTKSGKPLSFDKAIGELIESHPDKHYLLRGSGRVGSGSPGGTGGSADIDTTRLKPKDFEDPNVREKVRTSLQAPGGLQIGPGFDRLRRNANKS